MVDDPTQLMLAWCKRVTHRFGTYLLLPTFIRWEEFDTLKHQVSKTANIFFCCRALEINLLNSLVSRQVIRSV